MALKDLLTLGKGQSSRTCERTGLRLVRASGQKVARIAKPSWGSMNPPTREEGGDARSWGRFDVVNRQVVYGGQPVESAFAESLASFRVANDISQTVLSEVFANTSNKEATQSLLSLVTKEWEQRGHMMPGKIPAGWRLERRLYTLTLPSEGWFVDICHSDSVAALNRALSDSLMVDFEIDQITVSHLTGENRELTTSIAGWLWDQVLDDGRLAHGVSFPSKHGDDYRCFAIFLRARADGKELTSEPTKSDAGQEIKPPDRNAPLRKVLAAFDLGCF